MTTMKSEFVPERALAQLKDAELYGVARVEDTRDTPLYGSANTLLPGARSIIVAGMAIFPEVLRLASPKKRMGEAAARDLYEPHLDYLNGRLNRSIYETAKVIRASGYRALPMPSIGTPNDTRFLKGILSFKHAAEFAGMGRIGRSSLLVTSEFGPRLRLACLLTEVELPATSRRVADPCEGCSGLCIERCPSRALADPQGQQPYAINKYACASFRTASGSCATCMAVCPVGAS